jgi:hypothetical protein
MALSGERRINTCVLTNEEAESPKKEGHLVAVLQSSSYDHAMLSDKAAEAAGCAVQ